MAQINAKALRRKHSEERAPHATPQSDHCRCPHPAPGAHDKNRILARAAVVDDVGNQRRLQETHNNLQQHSQRCRRPLSASKAVEKKKLRIASTRGPYHLRRLSTTKRGFGLLRNWGETVRIAPAAITYPSLPACSSTTRPRC